MKDNYKQIIQEEILNEMFETWSDDTYKHLMYYALKNNRYDLLQKLKDYQKTRKNQDSSQRDYDRDYHLHPTLKNKPLEKKLSKFAPKFSFKSLFQKNKHPQKVKPGFAMSASHEDMEKDIHGDLLNNTPKGNAKPKYKTSRVDGVYEPEEYNDRAVSTQINNSDKTEKKPFFKRKGQEILTTPNVDRNSYSSPTEMNSIHKEEYSDYEKETMLPFRYRKENDFFYKFKRGRRAKQVAKMIFNGERRPNSIQSAIMKYKQYFDPKIKSDFEVAINQELAKLCAK